MHGLLAVLLFAADGVAAAGPVSEAPCPTAAQVDAELQRLGERAALEGLGGSEVTVVGGAMRVVLRDRTGAALGVREVVAPAECAARVSLAAVLLVAWAKTWNETALAPATRPASAPPHPGRAIEVGIAVGGTADGDATALAGSLLAVWQIHQALGAALTADIAGQRQVQLGPGSGAATYLVSRFGGGLAVRFGAGLVWTDAALLPQVTRLSLEGKNLMPGRAVTVWGASLEARGRVGLRWGRLAPFVGLALDRTLVRERLTLDDTNDSTWLSPWDLRAEAGVSWIFRAGG